MPPSVDIKTVRIMKMSSEEVGPPSPIDIDTPEEDQEEQEEKKKKKKKKKREEEREVSLHAKRKRRVEDEGPEVTEREPKRKKGDEMIEGLDLDVVNECGEKKRKKKKKLGEETIEGVGEDVANGGEKKKKKKKVKKTVVEETIVVVQENLVSEGVKKKKKKKQKVGVDTREGIGEDVFNGGEEEKKTTTVVEETIEVVEQNLVSEGQEKKKKKKKEIIEESLEAVEQNLGSEGVEKKNKRKKKKEATEETMEVVEQNLGSKGEEKKKMKKKKQKVVETSMGGLVQKNLVNEGVEKPKKKKKKKVIEETMKMVVVNKSVEKKKKQKVVEQSLEGAQENVVNKGRENKKKRKKGVKPGGEGLLESRGEVAGVNGGVEKTTSGTTQEAKGKESVRKLDDTTLPEDLLDLPDVREILEFIPKVRSRIVLEKFRLYDLQRFREFKKQGIPIRRGRCTAKEKQQIMKNVKDFMALTGISSAQELFFPERSKDRCKEIKKLRAQHCLIQKIGEGLQRPCVHVYSIARKMIDEFNHMGRFNEEEDDMLQRLQTRHGNDWREISKRMDRSTQALQKRFSQMASQHGAWESDEEKRLEQATRAHLETLLGPHQTGTASGPWLTQEQLTKNLPWKSISKKVQTRCWTQCREKWFTLLKARMASDQCPAFSGGVKAVKAKVKLINTLYNMDVEDPALIDWDEVAITIGEVSDFYVRKSFHRLKVSCVPMASQSSYPDIIDYLQEKTLPKLKEYLSVMGDTELPCQDKFLLSHIFSS